MHTQEPGLNSDNDEELELEREDRRLYSHELFHMAAELVNLKKCWFARVFN